MILLKSMCINFKEKQFICHVLTLYIAHNVSNHVGVNLKLLGIDQFKLSINGKNVYYAKMACSTKLISNKNNYFDHDIFEFFSFFTFILCNNFLYDIIQFII